MARNGKAKTRPAPKRAAVAVASTRNAAKKTKRVTATAPAHSKPSTAHRANTASLAGIPSMTALLNAALDSEAFSGFARSVVTAALRGAVVALREALVRGEAVAEDLELGRLLHAARERLTRRRARRLVRVINATGIVLHTGLGRSVLPQAAIDRITEVAGGYCNLEIDLDSGDRGLRGGHVEELLRELTGAEAALVVNNNAAATMLALRALAGGREVIVSRGQLIEIGGSYRLPEVMSAGGAILREVGTTNKTHLRDYQRAICDRTGLIMHVHTSNYRVVGFSQMPSSKELATLAHTRGLPFFDDLGSGALLEDELWRAADEPSAIASLRAGADVIAFSGDKLLGGPQAGILLGKRDIIDRLRKDPMARALRVGKLTMAALEAVLELYHDPAEARRRIPLLARLSESESSLMNRAGALSAALKDAAPGESFSTKPDESFAGGGSLPAWALPTATVRWTPTRGKIDEIARKLRTNEPSVLPRINEDAIVFDLRTIEDGEFADIANALARCLK